MGPAGVTSAPSASPREPVHHRGDGAVRLPPQEAGANPSKDKRGSLNMTERPHRYQVLFADLKRRRVFRVAAIYGAVAFAVMQAADFLVPALLLPEAVSTAIALLAIFGFPAAVVITWVFDLTPSGINRTVPADEGELEAIATEPRRRRWPSGILALVGIMMLAGGVWWTMTTRGAASSPSVTADGSIPPSVAVLPFVDMSGEDGEEYFSDGITEELVSALTRVPGLKVAARTSVFSLKGTQLDGTGVDVSEVADRLGVATVLEGSVERSADSVRIAAQLVRAVDGSRLWSGTYHQPLESIFDVQSALVSSVTQALGITVQQPAGTGPDSVSDPDVSAFDHYLRGRHHLGRGTLPALDSATASFTRSLLLDPDFALPWAALAETYVLIPELGGPPIAELLPYVRATTQRALALDPDLAQAYATSAYVKWTFDWDYEGAELDFLKAIELRPNEPVAHDWYAQLLATERRWDEALAEADRALALDPLSPAVHMTRGLVLLNLRLDEATAELRRSLDLAPDLHAAAYVLAGCLAMQGEYEEAAEMFDRFSGLTRADPAVYHAYLDALRDPRRRPAAVRALESDNFFGPMQGAELMAHLGEVDAALAALEGAVRTRSPYLPWVNAMPQFEALRSEPRFQAILGWLNF